MTILSEQHRSFIIASLREVQRTQQLFQNNFKLSDSFKEILGDHDPLTPDQIDELCEDINMADEIILDDDCPEDEGLLLVWP